MQRSYDWFARQPRLRGRSAERGVALVIALLLLMILTGLSVAMVLSVNSDMLVNGYYRNFRGSFYAADGGLNVVRQDIKDQFWGVVPLNGMANAFIQPIPTGTEGTVATYIQNTYGGSSKIKSITSGTGSAPQSFYIDTSNGNFTLAFVSCALTGAVDPGATCAAPGTKAPASYVYKYNYHMVSVGQAVGSQRSRVEEKGTLTITVPVSAYVPPFFSGYGMFFDNTAVCDGTTLVPGTISGPVFTNGGFTFGTSGQYIFTDAVQTGAAKNGYSFSGGCYQSSAPSYKSGSTTIAPTFKGGLQTSAPQIDLPGSSYSQMEAVIDAKGASVCHVSPCPTPSQPTKAQLNAALVDINGNPYPSSGASTGVFLPISGGHFGTNVTSSTCPTAPCPAGGIYVQGDAKVTVAAGATCNSSTCPQIYTIVQGSTTTTITIDNAANTTTFASGAKSTTVTGVPTECDPNTGAFVDQATMLYVTGNITSLSGPMNSGGTASTGAAIQDNTALTITAGGSVTIVGDITYKTEPVTLTQNQVVGDATSPCCNGQDSDTLIPGHDRGQALGIFTAGGDIILNNGQSSKNLEIDASIAPISSSGSTGLVNNGASINTLTIVGGRVQSTIKNIGATTRNVFFDKRFGGNFAPPWFPTTVVHQAANPAPPPTPVYRRTQWVVQGNY